MGEVVLDGLRKSGIGVGVMSGTSLDGVDLCCVQFTQNANIEFSAKNTRFIPYDQTWKLRLKSAAILSGSELIKLHVDYGHFLGDVISDFLAHCDVTVDFVACHGHTIFHQPENGFTFQLGEGETIASHLPCPLVCNFRSRDVALGGQGAPLVPSGEKFLFQNYDFCVNLGGVCNISVPGSDRGYDVCPCNLLLNHLAAEHDNHLEFDEDGKLSRQGHIAHDLLQELNALEYYSKKPPKSLGREWFEDAFLPCFKQCVSGTLDQLRTGVEHIAEQLTQAVHRELLLLRPATATHTYSVLCTGGGALNTYLMETIRSQIRARGMNVEIARVSRELVEFKEAIIFSFLGWRLLNGDVNLVGAVTGVGEEGLRAGSIHPPRATRASLQSS